MTSEQVKSYLIRAREAPPADRRERLHRWGRDR